MVFVTPSQVLRPRADRDIERPGGGTPPAYRAIVPR
jgi:hypothetical protein